MKKISFAIATLLITGAVANAADNTGKPPTKPPPPSTSTQLNPHLCPAPYEKFEVPITDGIAKGEYFCKKKPAPCPANFYGSVDTSNGELTCHPDVVPSPPISWSKGKLTGTIVFESNPQPLINCPTSPDWQWGTVYYKDSWNKMGCMARLKPAY